MLPVHRQVLPVQLSPLWPGLSLMGFYQAPEADSSSRMGAGDTDDSLHRRYSPVGRDLGESQTGLLYLLQCLGFTVNLEKTKLEPSQCLEFLGYTMDTTRMELSLPAQKIKKIRAIEGGVSFSPHPLQINWQDECHKPSDPTSSLVLQEPTNGPGSSPERSRPGL